MSAIESELLIVCSSHRRSHATINPALNIGTNEGNTIAKQANHRREFAYFWVFDKGRARAFRHGYRFGNMDKGRDYGEVWISGHGESSLKNITHTERIIEVKGQSVQKKSFFSVFLVFF